MSRISSTVAFLLGMGLAGFAGRVLAQEPLAEVPEPGGEGMVQEDSVPQEATSADFKRRDPFWPVGYQPPSPEQVKAASEEEEIDRPWPSLPVRGRSVAPDGSIRVLIEGIGVVGVNKVVSVADQGYRFYWRILRIDEKGIELKRLGIKSELPPKPSVPKGDSSKENKS